MVIDFLFPMYAFIVLWWVLDNKNACVHFLPPLIYDVNMFMDEWAPFHFVFVKSINTLKCIRFFKLTSSTPILIFFRTYIYIHRYIRKFAYILKISKIQLKSDSQKIVEPGKYFSTMSTLETKCCIWISSSFVGYSKLMQ